MTQPTPLQRLLSTQAVVDKELAAVLRDAAQEGERIMARLAAKGGVGATVRRAEVAIYVRELRTMQASLWGHVTKATQAGMARAAMQAAEAENLINRTFFNAIGGPIPEYERAMHIRAQVAVQNYQSRMDNGISLSDQVYKTQALSNGIVDRQINRGLLLGMGHEALAKSVVDLINPNVIGGVSYAADRLARTEINNAFHRTQIDQRTESPFTDGFQWHLSGSHPKPDECNDYASGVHRKGGDPGVYDPSDVPGKPHPNCLCYLTTVQKSEDEMLAAFMNGDYNTHIDEQIYKYAPHVSPCA